MHISPGHLLLQLHIFRHQNHTSYLLVAASFPALSATVAPLPCRLYQYAFTQQCTLSLTCTGLLDDGLEVAPLLPPLSKAQSQAEWDRAQEQARKEAEIRENQEQVRKDGSPQAPSRYSKQVLGCNLVQQDNTSNSHQFRLG
jgi:hypothetical protein